MKAIVIQVDDDSFDFLPENLAVQLLIGITYNGALGTLWASYRFMGLYDLTTRCSLEWLTYDEYKNFMRIMGQRNPV